VSATPAPGPRRTLTHRLTLLREPSWAANVAFAAVLALGAAIVIHETRGLSFSGDEWDFLLERRGLSAGVLLRPHGPHLVLLPILIYKILLALFGGRSYLPFRLLTGFDIAFVGFAIGLVCRSRWGRWWGLAPVLLFVTLGPGAITLLLPFQVGYSVAVAAGILGLLALERRWPYADAICCVALVVSLASGSQGVGFVVGAAVMLVIGEDWRRRAWVVVVPAVLYLLWYAKYGHQYSETHLSLWTTSLRYVFDSLSATAAGVVGLTSVSPTTGVLDLTYGIPLAVASVGLIATASWRGWRPTAIFWGVAATLVICWVAASVSNFGVNSRPAADPRYLSTNVALLLICLCAALPRPRLAAGGTVIAGVVLVIVAATNAHQFTVPRTSLLTSDADSRAQLGALAILRPVVGPHFVLSDAIADPAALIGINAGQFYSAADDFGLDYDSPSQLPAAPEVSRASADAVLAGAELKPTPLSHPHAQGSTPPHVLVGSSRAADACRTVTSTQVTIRAVPGRYEVLAPHNAAATVTVARFAQDTATPLASVGERTGVSVSVPRDGAPQTSWRMTVAGPGSRICAT
jgi:hypothetical protein